MKKEITHKIIFLFFCGLTGFLEIGSVIYAIRVHLTVNQVLFLVLAYQVGCFFPNNIQFSKKLFYIISFVGFCMYLYISIIFPNYYLLWLATLFTSICLQTLRSFQKSSVSTGLKRTFRIIGFGLAPFFSLPAMSFLSLILIFFLIFNKNILSTKIKFYKLKLSELIMVTHQMHYFSYSYLILLIIMLIGKFSAYYACLSFVLGWITYAMLPYLLKNINKHQLIFVAGHIYLALVLIFMSFTNSIEFKILLWIITGFGGGTVYCIEKIYASYNDLNKGALEFSENIGHVLGLTFGILIFNITNSYNMVIISAGTLTIITVMLMILYIKSKQVKIYIG